MDYLDIDCNTPKVKNLHSQIKKKLSELLKTEEQKVDDNLLMYSLLLFENRHTKESIISGLNTFFPDNSSAPFVDWLWKVLEPISEEQKRPNFDSKKLSDKHISITKPVSNPKKTIAKKSIKAQKNKIPFGKQNFEQKRKIEKNQNFEQKQKKKIMEQLLKMKSSEKKNIFVETVKNSKENKSIDENPDTAESKKIPNSFKKAMDNLKFKDEKINKHLIAKNKNLARAESAVRCHFWPKCQKGGYLN
ncbi:hypothetical protein MHBO_001567, partial [Bonamia ostreae]